ncbi:MAG: hypothetical protein LBQ35_01790 [Spirochaetaceae bacterium]|nr:hypothetical protein [Spirochaetaceae bacterium]
MYGKRVAQDTTLLLVKDNAGGRIKSQGGIAPKVPAAWGPINNWLADEIYTYGEAIYR